MRELGCGPSFKKETLLWRERGVGALDILLARCHGACSVCLSQVKRLEILCTIEGFHFFVRVISSHRYTS